MNSESMHKRVSAAKLCVRLARMSTRGHVLPGMAPVATRSIASIHVMSSVPMRIIPDMSGWRSGRRAACCRE
jgi:hypothetical protein